MHLFAQFLRLTYTLVHQFFVCHLCVCARLLRLAVGANLFCASFVQYLVRTCWFHVIRAYFVRVSPHPAAAGTDPQLHQASFPACSSDDDGDCRRRLWRKLSWHRRSDHCQPIIRLSRKPVEKTFAPKTYVPQRPAINSVVPSQTFIVRIGKRWMTVLGGGGSWW